MGRSDPMIDRIMGITRQGGKQVEPPKEKNYKYGLALQCVYCTQLYVLREPEGVLPEDPTLVPREHQQYSLQQVPGCFACLKGEIRWFIVFGGPLPEPLRAKFSGMERSRVADIVVELMERQNEQKEGSKEG